MQIKIMKSAIVSFSLLFFSITVFAKEKLTGGTLQAYWRAAWNAEATINTPELNFRYFPAEGSSYEKYIIDIIFKGSDEEKIAFVKKNFANIPGNFLDYHEWYVNQQGTVNVKKVEEYMLCNASNYEAELISFTPSLFNENTNTQGENRYTNCGYGGRYPYLTSYTLKPDAKSGQLKPEPNDNAENSYTFTHDNSVVKIKTINKEWMYVSLYDLTKPDLLSDKRGYIKFSDVEPLN
ncbi:hypothetical protein M1E08_03355 [Erwinia sp. PK3-005]